MTVSFMKKAKDFQPTGSLKFLLHSHLSGPEKARSLSILHASDLTKPEGMCPRYYALHDELGKKPQDRWLSTADVITYEMGNNLQDAIVNHYADMGRVVGHWKCLGCKVQQEFCKRPGECPECGCKAFKPEEVRFKSKVTGASCGVDMLVNLGFPKLVPVELKSMIKDQFRELVAPLQEHRLRTNLYLRLIAEADNEWSGQVATEEARVAYFCKGGYVADPELKKMGLHDTFSPMKEYKVKRDDKRTDDLSLRALAVAEYRAGKTSMPCGICSTALVKRAKGCAVKAACFSGDHPGEYDWQKAGKAP